MQRQIERCGWLLLIALGAIVLAFMGPSLAITATGTARFAVAMGYRAEVGYAVGAVFDLAKGMLPIALLALFARRSFLFFVVLGLAWLGLVSYSALATHATATTAIAAIERTGSWKMEIRSDTKAELATVEKRLEVLSQPKVPRPTKSLAEALAVEKVAPGVWRDSQECQCIRGSKYFQSACAKVLGLRRELAGRKLRQELASTPLVATSDPLPEAFTVTLGRLLPFDGRVGVALLLTLVIEIISCFGLAALRTLGEERGTPSFERVLALPEEAGSRVVANARERSPGTGKLFPEGAENIPSNSALTAASLGSLTSREGRNLPRKQSSDVFTVCEKTTKARGDKGASLKPSASSDTVAPPWAHMSRRSPLTVS